MLVYLSTIDHPADRDKFTILYELYRDAMLCRAWQILRNQQDAEDAVHDAFLTIADNMKKISDPRCRKTRNYIVTITESKAIDLYRKHQRNPTEPLLEGTAIGETEDQVINTLAECILRLPERYRTLVYLKYEQGFRNREIAHIMGIRETAVRKLDQRTRERLMELCKEEGLDI